MNLLKLKRMAINLDAVAMMASDKKGRLMVTLSCGREVMIDAEETQYVRRQLELDKKPTVYLPPVESYLSQVEQEAWSFIQGSDDKQLSIGKVYEHLIGGNLVEGLEQAGEVLSKLKNLNLIKIEHASGESLSDQR